MKEIPLTRGYVALVDDEDFEWLSQWKWCVHFGGTKYGKPYAMRRSGDHTMRIHRLVMGCTKGDGRHIDHINGNSLDNRRSNLRDCTPSQNGENAHANRKGSSRFKGVSQDRGRWRARIRVKRKLYSLGHFDTEEEAARAYNESARDMFGDYACLNPV